MIPKVVGYQGFQSYGDLPYAALKPGKPTLDSNQVWEKSQRNEDKISYYHNTNYLQTIKSNQIDTIPKPLHYEKVEIVKKGTNGFFQNAASTTLNQKTQSVDACNNDFVKTGTEHWKTNYQAGIVDPFSKNRAQRPEWTYHKPPHQVFSKVGPSEYKKQMGELGSNPRDVIKDLSDTNPRVFDELRFCSLYLICKRLGSTQNSLHPPGYTGFIPTIQTSSKATEHGQGLEPRKDFMKTNLKENYHTKIPGYAGHIPRSVVNQREEPRGNCLGNSQG